MNFNDEMEIKRTHIQVPGLTKKYRFWHVSDCHIVYAYPDDAEEDQEQAREHAKKWNTNNIPPLEVFGEVLKNAEMEKVDALLIAGDCADFFHESTTRYMEEQFQQKNVDILYVYGNHEGASYVTTIPDTHVYYPYYKNMMQGNPSYWVKDYEKFLIVGIDNSDKKITEEQFSFIKGQATKNIPIFLLMHVPIITEEIITPIKITWGENGLEYFGLGDEKDSDLTKQFCEFVKSEESNVEAIFAGHLHFDHESEFAERRKQYVSAPTLRKYIHEIIIEA